MTSISFKTPFQIGDDIFSSATILPLTFVKFVEVTRAALAKKTAKDDFKVMLQRERIMHQVQFATGGDKKIKLDESGLTQIPYREARDIVRALDEDEVERGSIITEGDGIDKPILFKLGQAIKGTAGKEIAELEFKAGGFSEMEAVLAAADDMEQTIALLSHVAKPIGASLLSLPSWALEQISLADGITIMNKVRPRFFE
jgi:hypothetical protein